MSLLYILVMILAVGVLAWAVHTYGAAYVQPPFLKLFEVVAIVGVILWLFWIVGLFDFLRSIRIGRL